MDADQRFGSDAADHGISKEIVQALARCGRPILRRIEIRVDSGRATLNGHVSSFYLKQLAQTVTTSVPGVTTLENLLIVEESHS